MHHFAIAIRPGMWQTASRLSSSFAPGLRPTLQILNSCVSQRSLSTQALKPLSLSRCRRTTLSKGSLPLVHRDPPPTPPNSPPSSFFTPSICRYPIRHNSTSAQSPSHPASTSTQPRSPPTEQATIPNTLDWNNFFRLRASRRRFSITSSILGAALVTVGAMYTLATYPEVGDQITKVAPIDPMIGLGFATFAATLLGWLLGPMFGNAIWRMLYRSRLPEFMVKERAFFERVKKHRVNPAGASANNPVPDFYGEKVGSVSGYRRWLKDQRAFNRKRKGVYV